MTDANEHPFVRAAKSVGIYDKFEGIYALDQSSCPIRNLVGREEEVLPRARLNRRVRWRERSQET